jgi:hypothetical protein
VASGRVRIIEYEIVSWTDVEQMGELATLLSETMAVGSQVGILRCVTQAGRKVTFAGDGDTTRRLVASTAASSPGGIAIAKKDFPVMMDGWPFRFRNA